MSERLSGVMGIVAFVAFWAALAGFGAAHPDYSHSTKAISELGVIGAPHALAWNILGFMVPGVLLAICGSGLALSIDEKKGLLWWTLILSGVGFAGTGLIPAEMHNGSPLRTSSPDNWSCADVDPVRHRMVNCDVCSGKEGCAQSLLERDNTVGLGARAGRVAWHVCQGSSGVRVPTGAGTARCVRHVLFLVSGHVHPAFIRKPTDDQIGRLIRNLDPRGSFSNTAMRPPWACAIRRASDKPMPEPPGLVVKNGTKICSR